MVGQATWAKLTVKPIDPTKVSLRWRIWDDDIYGSKGLRFTDTYLQTEHKFNKTWKAIVRGSMRWDLPDPDAEWADACDLVGRPDLSGACAVTPDADDLATSRSKPETLILATVEARFR